MSEFLSPGIFIEETSNAVQTVDAVSTSTMAIVGWTKQGPVDEATVITSPTSFQRSFGGNTHDSLVPLSVSAFFTNGGSRSYVVRVVPSDAVKSAAAVPGVVSGESFGTTGTGVSPQTKTHTLAFKPTPGTTTVSWKKYLTATSENPVMAPPEDESTLVMSTTVANPGLTDDVLTLVWSEYVAVVSENPTMDPAENGVVIDFTAGAADMLVHANLTPWPVTVAWTRAAAPKTATITGTNTLGGTDVAELDAATNINRTTGEIQLKFAGGDPPDADSIRVSYHYIAAGKTATITGTSTLGGANAANITLVALDRVAGTLAIQFAATHAPLLDTVRATYNYIGATGTITDDGVSPVGAFTGVGIAGTIVQATGVCSIVFTGAGVVPYNGDALTVTYTGNQWDFVAANEGVWGNDLKVRLKGNDNFFSYNLPTVVGAGSWTKYDVLVMLKNPDTLVYEVKETYEELSFTDAADVMYAPDVINDSSSLVTLTDNGYLDVPATFKGANHLAEAIGAANGILITFTDTASVIPVVKNSLKVHMTIGGSPFVAYADADGNITEDLNDPTPHVTHLDTTKTNSINWTTGSITVNFLAGQAPTVLTMDYVSYPTTSYVDYTLAAGADGTMAYINQNRVSSAAALQADRKGLYAMDRIDDIFQIVIPDFAGDPDVQGDMVDYCDGRRDCFAILTTPSARTAQQAVDWNRITFNKKSKYAAIYWPWVTVADPLANGRALLVPPVAHIAGVYARTDSTKNVGKSPAGMVDGALRGILGLEMKPSKGDRDLVYPARINPLIDSSQTGRAVWGTRTLSPTSDAFKWVSAVRLFIFVEKSVFNSTHNLVFENIGAGLYTSIKAQLDGFLLNLFNQGYFAGSTPSQAYKVICDSSNNPPEVANAGQVVVSVAIAPNRPGEFIRFVFSQTVLS
jgi:phage tail sheath protein FI